MDGWMSGEGWMVDEGKRDDGLMSCVLINAW